MSGKSASGQSAFFRPDGQGKTYDEAIARLLALREARVLKRDIGKLTETGLNEELSAWGCSLRGSLLVRRERLLRRCLPEHAPSVSAVPWFEWDSASGAELVSDGEIERACGFVAKAKKLRRRASQRAQPPQEASEPKQGALRIVRADVHVQQARGLYPSVATASMTPAANSVAVTTQVGNSAAPTWLTSLSGQPIPSTGLEGLERPLDRSRGTEVGPTPATLGWEYFSARMMRGVGPLPSGVRMEAASEREERVSSRGLAASRAGGPPRVGKTPRAIGEASANASRNERCYTPEDEIRPASEEESGLDGSPAASRSGEDSVDSAASRRSSQRSSRISELRESGLSAERAREQAYAEELEACRAQAFADELAVARARLSEEAAEHEHEARLARACEEARAEAWRVAQEEEHRRSDWRAQLRSTVSPLETHPLHPRKSSVPTAKESRRMDSRAERRVLESEDTESERESWQTPRRQGWRRSQQRWSPNLLDSDSESDVSSARASKPRVAASPVRPDKGKGALEAVKLLKSWELRFSGEEKNEDPEEFLERLDDCRRGSNLSERQLLAALPSIFEMRAGRWYRTVREELRNWEQFCKAFRRQFVVECDREDLMEDLRRRTQHKGEKIAMYLANIKYIVTRFRRPPTERELLSIAYRNVLPEYRKAIGDKLIESLEDLERYGRRWEKQRDLDSRYAPPLPAQKMHVPGAAYSGAGAMHRVAAVGEAGQSIAAAVGVTSSVKQAKRAKKSQKRVTASSSSSETEPEASVAIQAKFTPTAAGGGQPQKANAGRGLFGAEESSKVGNACGVKAGKISPASTLLGATSVRRGEFRGVCYTCQQVGHRASQCPEIVCYRCRQKGHSAKSCDWQNSAHRNSSPTSWVTARVSCQLCGRNGCTILSCPECKIIATLGNLRTRAPK